MATTPRMNEVNTLRLGCVNITHPSARERASGAKSEVYLQLWTSGGERPRFVPLDEDDLTKLIANAAEQLVNMRKANSKGAGK